MLDRCGLGLTRARLRSTKVSNTVDFLQRGNEEFVGDKLPFTHWWIVSAILRASRPYQAGIRARSLSLECVFCLRAGLRAIPALSSSRSRRKASHPLPEAAPEELSQHSVSRL